MKRIYVCAPLAGDIEANVIRVDNAMVILRREAETLYDKMPLFHKMPLFLVPHYVLHTITFGFDGEIDREWGMECCLELIRISDKVVVIGKEITAGMKQEIDLARELGKVIVHRVEL